MPKQIPTDIPCPNCTGKLFQLENQQGVNVYGCDSCGVTWKNVDGRLVPALDALRAEWERELKEREL